MAMGTAHPANKQRYVARTDAVRQEACGGNGCGRALIQGGAQGVPDRFPPRRPPRLPLIILSELRLILRVFRRSGMDRQFPAVVEKLLEAGTPAELSTAAE
jgi:hypothetical protein